MNVRKFSFFAALVAALCLLGGESFAAPSRHRFQVGDSSYVYFSPGNLQFRAASTTGTPLMHRTADGMAQGEWRFAEHQWDFVGGASSGGSNNGQAGTVYEAGELCTNNYTTAPNTIQWKTDDDGSHFTGWIDWFAWGTSGFAGTQPWIRQISPNGKTISGTNYDWGVYNQIGKDAPGTWRTMNRTEWNYVINRKKDGKVLARYGYITASVNGSNKTIAGLILLPDDWDFSKLALNSSYTEESWAKMEAAGAIFMPGAGACCGNWRKVNNEGNYWINGTNSQSCLVFHSGSVNEQSSFSTNFDYSRTVRLVRDADVKIPAITCDNEEFVWEGHNKTFGKLSAGVYTFWDSLKSVSGCDSIFKLTLTVNKSYRFDTSVIACGDEPYIWRGRKYDKSGVYYDRLTSVTGCDSVFSLNLTIAPTYFTVDSGATYEDIPYVWAGHNVAIPTTPGRHTVMDTLKTVYGCDSVCELRLTVRPVIYITDVLNACDNEKTFYWQNHQSIDLPKVSVITELPATTDRVEKEDACYIYTLRLSVHPSYYFEE